MRWIEESNPSSSVFLIQGRRGVGKTALLQSIAERLQGENRQSYACFFFKQDLAECDNLDQLFSTLAYQLAINTSGLREHVDHAMIEDPALPKKSPATQLQKLIIDPLKLLPTPRPSPILIIDGLDECEGEEFQDAFFVLISQGLLDPAVTMRFIISGPLGSRYESMSRNRLVLGWLAHARPFSHRSASSSRNMFPRMRFSVILTVFLTFSLYFCPRHCENNNMYAILYI
jgi:DNA polymerase III delta prime subunit